MSQIMVMKHSGGENKEKHNDTLTCLDWSGRQPSYLSKLM